MAQVRTQCIMGSRTCQGRHWEEERLRGKLLSSLFHSQMMNAEEFMTEKGSIDKFEIVPFDCFR